ncbi:unnamed protein product [Camellia sinensis]
MVWLVNIGHFRDPAHGGFLQGAIHYFKRAYILLQQKNILYTHLRPVAPHFHPVTLIQRYFLSSSLLLVECRRVKILTNFCFCNPRKNHDEYFYF